MLRLLCSNSQRVAMSDRVKTVLDEEGIPRAFADYISQLSPDKTAIAVKSIARANTAEELTPELRNVLNLAEYKVPRGFLSKLKQISKYTVNDYCISPDFLKKAQQDTIQLILESYKQYMLNYVTIVSGRLHRDKEDDRWEDKRMPQYKREADIMKDTRNKVKQNLENVKESIRTDNPLLVEYAEHLMKGLRETWKKDGEQTQSILNGRQVLKIQKPILLLSECFENAEKFIEANREISKVEEVHFVAQEIFYIDCNLENRKWHGINILVVAKTVYCVPISTQSLTWDVSGLHGYEKLEQFDDTVTKRYGKAGANGRNGNCGNDAGHVMFVTGHFDGIEYLTVKANGGMGEDGGNGENGRDGTDGVDGQHIPPDQVRQRFISLVKSDEVRKVTLKNLNTEIKDVIFSIPYKITKPHNNSYRTGELNIDILGGLSSFYIKATTHEGVDIECGFRNGAFSPREAFLLVRGASGKPGTRGGIGGKGGFGGLGGMSGTVELYELEKLGDQSEPKKRNDEIKVELENGKDGNNGTDGISGRHGKPGKTGKDVGYVEGRAFRADFPQTPETSGYYELATYEVKQDGCVYSDYHGMYVTIQEREVQELSFLEEQDDGYEYGVDAIRSLQVSQMSGQAASNQPINLVNVKVHIDYVMNDEIQNMKLQVDANWWRNKLTMN